MTPVAPVAAVALTTRQAMCAKGVVQTMPWGTYARVGVRMM